MTERRKHTPTPWDISCFAASSEGAYFTVRDVHGRKIARVYSGEVSHNQTDANARRIVAAMNACEGISTGALENGAVSELLEALKSACDVMRGRGLPVPSMWSAAIAKAEVGGETKR